MQRIVGKQIFDCKGKADDAAQRPHDIGQQGLKAFFRMFGKVCHGMNDLAVDSHGDSQRTAANAWQNVGYSHENTFKEIGKRNHGKSFMMEDLFQVYDKRGFAHTRIPGKSFDFVKLAV